MSTASSESASANASSATEPRLVELEVRYTHLEHQVAELNQIVFEQHRSIEHLQKELAALRGNVQALGDPLSNEPPPPY